MRVLCQLADTLESLCGDNISELQFNMLAKQGMIIIRRDPSFSKEEIDKVIRTVIHEYK
jgi:hypothetical protein